MKTSQLTLDKPITIVYHDGSMDVKNDRDDIVRIDCFDTEARAQATSPSQWDALKRSQSFMRLFRLVFPDVTLPEHPLQLHGSGVRHVVGLIVLTVLAMHDNKVPMWSYPETHLHPSAQLGMGDLLIALTKESK